MTEQELDRLQAICDTASSGPWGVGPDGRRILRVDADGVPLPRTGQRCAGDRFPYVGEAGLYDDAPLMAAAREAMPALIADNRELEAENAKLRHELIEALYELSVRRQKEDGGDWEEFKGDGP